MRIIRIDILLILLLFAFNSTRLCSQSEEAGSHNVSNSNQNEEGVSVRGIFCDERDNQVYRWVMIGSKIWMAENLNYGKYISRYTNPANNGVVEKYCYKNDTDFCDQYGGLYRWNEMMDYSIMEGTQGICPQGWYLPTKEDYEELLSLADSLNAAESLKSSSGWEKYGPGDDDYGFNALSGGRVHSKSANHYDGMGKHAYFWSSTNYEIRTSWSWVIYGDESEIKKVEGNNDDALSVRCVKEL